MKMTKAITKWMTGAALAGALLLAAPHKAEAQHVSFGVSVGAPVVYGGGYYGPRYVRPYPYAYGYPYYGPSYYGYGRPYYGGYAHGYYGRGGYYGPRPWHR